MSEQLYMTSAGKKKLEAELKDLKLNVRPKVIKAIQEARAHGDLSENAEYHAAKERQGFVEGRIADLNNKLALVHIVDPKNVKLNKVAFGATVTLKDEVSGKKVTYQIVGMDEADLKERKISYKSPLAKAMLGKAVKEDFGYETARGDKAYTILKIEFK